MPSLMLISTMRHFNDVRINRVYNAMACKRQQAQK